MSAAESAPSAPLLALSAARLRLRDGTRLPELDVTADGERVALVGAFGPFFGLLTGEVELAGGSAQLLGVPAARAVVDGLLGLALLDPPFPRSWSAERYLVESARLLGLGKRPARERARELLSRFELSHIGARMLTLLPVFERRSLVIAHATLANPKALCCEAPLDRLEGEAAAYVAVRLERALEGRKGIVHFQGVAPAGPERAWLDRADTVVLLEHDQILANGPPETALSPAPRVLVTVTRRGDAFRSELERRGGHAQPVGHFASLLPALVTREGATLERFLILLTDPSDTRPILEAARAAEAPLVELRPLDRA